VNALRGHPVRVDGVSDPTSNEAWTYKYEPMALLCPSLSSQCSLDSFKSTIQSLVPQPPPNDGIITFMQRS
jgi:hypothetical protein